MDTPDIWHSGPQPLPGAMEIERLAVAMAAGYGVIWTKLDAAARGNYRIWASAGLIHLGLEGRAAGQLVLKETLEQAVNAMRRAAAVTDLMSENEKLTTDLHRIASGVDMLAGMLEDADEVIG